MPYNNFRTLLMKNGKGGGGDFSSLYTEVPDLTSLSRWGWWWFWWPCWCWSEQGCWSVKQP